MSCLALFSYTTLSKLSRTGVALWLIKANTKELHLIPTFIKCSRLKYVHLAQHLFIELTKCRKTLVLMLITLPSLVPTNKCYPRSTYTRSSENGPPLPPIVPNTSMVAEQEVVTTDRILDPTTLAAVPAKRAMAQHSVLITRNSSDSIGRPRR